MHCTQSSALATTSSLAAIIAEGRPVTGVSIDAILPSTATVLVPDIAAILDELTEEQRRLAWGSGAGASVTDMVRRARALADFADTARDALLPLVTRLEAAGATIDLLPDRGRLNPEIDPDPEACVSPVGVALRFCRL